MNRAKLFAEKVGIAVKTAKNIIDLLYKKGLDAKAFDRVMWKLERLVRETQLAKIMDQQTDDTINGIIDEMILQDSRCQDMPCEAYSERMWYFTDISEMFGEGENQKVLKAGDEVTIQIMRAGQRNHPLYGKIAVDKKVLKDVKKNFDENVRGIQIGVDENHEPNHKSLARYKKLFFKGQDALFAVVELTKKGADLINEGAYKYFSPELIFRKIDEETGKEVKNLLIGGAFTNRPFFKAMQPLLANELSSEATDRHQTGDESHEYNDTLFLYNSDTMKKFLELIAAFSEMETISAEQKAALDKAFSELTETDKASSKETYNLITGKFSEDNKSTEGTTEEETDETETEEEKTAEEVKASEETEEETDTEEETEEETETETVTEETTETETVTVKASEYENLKKNQGEYAKLVREKRKTLLESKFGELVFNEETKKGAFLPKSKSKLVNFALGLSEKKGDEFFEILKDLALNGSKFSEIGSAATGEKTSEFSEEQIAVVMKTAKVSREDAIVALTEDAAERKANQ